MQESKNMSATGESVRRRRIAVGVLLGLVTAVVLVTAAGSFPFACSLCHGSQASAMEATAHASTSCYDCHLENGAWGFAAEKHGEFTRMYPAALFGKGLMRPARETGRSSCLACHDDVLKGVTSGDGLRIKHRSCAVGPTCDGCHSTTAHAGTVRFETHPSMQECVFCHEGEEVSTECTTCHAGKPQERRDIKGPWQVTHGPQWREMHGMGDQSSCGTCHPAGFCSKCHVAPVPHPADFGASHGAYAVNDRKSCLTCHKSEKDFCEACHGLPLPHSAEFTKQHGSIAKGVKDPKCVRCHVETDCGLCHSYHAHPGGPQGVPVPWTYTSEELRP